MPRPRRFAQVDVFGSGAAYSGNALAVVLDADGLADDEMAAIARWTQLSETTFLLPPTTPEADYRVRIFTGSGELPFAGHPTLGSAHAWLEAGNTPRGAEVVQECPAGLIRIRPGERPAFAAPPLLRSGPVDEPTLDRLRAGLGVDTFTDHQWVDNGPGWVAVLLDSPDRLLALEPDARALRGLWIGAAALEPPGAATDLHVRAFIVEPDVVEDPVTGSLNAGLAQWLIGTGRLPDSYVARQGMRLGRDGRVFLDRVDTDVWVGGACTTQISGTVLA